MTESILYLFPDTNVFVQCKPLEQLDWSKWKGFSEVHLVVSRPVQREIDNQKNRGNDRVAKKARKTYSLFRKIILGQAGYEMIRASEPTVKLYIEEQNHPSPELKGSLDYSKPDDEIVGCLHRFRQENPNLDARLLTHDTGPMMTATSLGLPLEAVNENWILPPEHNELEGASARLRERVARLEKTEPLFTIELIYDEGKGLERLDLEYLVFDPLSSDEVETLMNLLSNSFPKTTDFGSSKPVTRDRAKFRADDILGLRTYHPPTEVEIDRYNNQEYPGWIRECRKVLTNLHEQLQKEVGQPAFTFAISNQGTRPGNNALVNIVAKGNFKIYVPPYTPEWDEDIHSRGKLPDPPRPPQWKSLISQLNRPWSIPSFTQDALSVLPQTNRGRDLNGFYYKPSRPVTPGESITLECEQWRHSTGEKQFWGHLHVDPNVEQVSGALVCEVHAENLSSPVKKLISVSIHRKKGDTTGPAKALVQSLIESAK